MGFWQKTSVLVTGAGGFIGSHLVEKLLALGANVTAFVRYNSRNEAGLLEFIGDKEKGVRIVYGDIRELETVRDVVKGASIVFHLAALTGTPYSYIHASEVVEVNTLGALNVLNAAREYGVSRVIFTSTCEVYGTALYVPIDERHPKQSKSPYGASKIAADAISLSFCHSFGLPVTIVRLFNTYGPRQSDRAIIPTIICQALTKEEILIGNTKPTRDFTFITDIIEGFIRVTESERSVGEEINLGSGREISIGNLAKKIATLIGREIRIRQAEDRLRPMGSEVDRLISDSSKARESVGWEPEVDLDEGLNLTIEWIKNHLGMYAPNAYRI